MKRFFGACVIALALVLVRPHAAEAIATLVHTSTCAGNGVAGTFTCTITATTAGSSMLIVDAQCAAAGGTIVFPAATATVDAVAGQCVGIAYYVSPTTGTTSILITVPTTTISAAVVYEVSNSNTVSVLDGHNAGAFNASGTSCAGSSITPTQSDDIIVSWGYLQSTFSALTYATSPVTTAAVSSIDAAAYYAIGGITIDYASVSAITGTFSWTTSSQNLCGTAAFKALGGGGGSSPKSLFPNAGVYPGGRPHAYLGDPLFEKAVRAWAA